MGVSNDENVEADGNCEDPDVDFSSIHNNEVSKLVDGRSNQSNHLVSPRYLTPTAKMSTVNSSLASTSGNSDDKETYLQWRKNQGNTITQDSEERSVRKYTRDHLFSKVKFITSKSELDYKGKVELDLFCYFQLCSPSCSCLLCFALTR